MIDGFAIATAAPTPPLPAIISAIRDAPAEGKIPDAASLTRQLVTLWTRAHGHEKKLDAKSARGGMQLFVCDTRSELDAWMRRIMRRAPRWSDPAITWCAYGQLAIDPKGVNVDFGVDSDILTFRGTLTVCARWFTTGDGRIHRSSTAFGGDGAFVRYRNICERTDNAKETLESPTGDIGDLTQQIYDVEFGALQAIFVPCFALTEHYVPNGHAVAPVFS